MEQQTDIRQRLAGLIAEPDKVSQDDTLMLQALAELYPYFQPVHLLKAKAASQGGDLQEANSSLATAALYTNGQFLHNFIHSAEHSAPADFKSIHFPGAENGTNEPESLDEILIDEVPLEQEGHPVADEQETFDEIGEIDSQYFQQPNPEPAEDQPTASQEMLQDDLVLENIVATDFFAFQDNFKVEQAPDATSGASIQIEEYIEPEETVISKYDDDRLPYTFLWWLAKTRKEHQQIFQPYASPKQTETKPQPGAGTQHAPAELQQQYVEHIFHLQTPFSESGPDYSPTHFKRPSKGDEIIESFIKNEPQISPPKPEQINNENKAKKSAEDHNDLVSETLANIYIEQMLYDKAIETYEKLSLKFPEKSRYFADLIQSIEKKI